MTWAAILVAAAGCFALKFAGLSVPERVLQDARVKRVADLLPIGLLGALIATQTFAEGRHLTIDARVAGVLVGALAVSRKAPFLLVVALAAGTTALLRAVA